MKRNKLGIVTNPVDIMLVDWTEEQEELKKQDAISSIKVIRPNTFSSLNEKIPVVCDIQGSHTHVYEAPRSCTPYGKLRHRYKARKQKGKNK